MAAVEEDAATIRSLVHNVLANIKNARTYLLSLVSVPGLTPRTIEYLHRAETNLVELSGDVGDVEEQLASIRSYFESAPSELTGGGPISGAVAQARGQIDAVAAALVPKLTHFRDRLFPNTFLALWGLLSVLSLVGVVWPLAELTLLTGDIPIRAWLMVTIFGAAVLVMIVYFAVLLEEVRAIGRFKWVRLP
jgi:hypothetical protein